MSKNEKVTIVLDASFDLNEAMEDTSEKNLDSFEKAYLEAAELLSDWNEVEIEVIIERDCCYDGPVMRKNNDPNNLWQAIHDMVNLVDGEWVVLND